MIALRDDCLLVAQADGGFVPQSVEDLTFEIVGDGAGLVDAELLKHAAAAVLHYFRKELERNTVTLAEFGAMLARVLQGLGFSAEVKGTVDPDVRIADLGALAVTGGAAGELEFCQKLRTLLREQLAAAPLRLEIRGLRTCVKRLTGRKHWCPECRRWSAWIVYLLRSWLSEKASDRHVSLVVR